MLPFHQRTLFLFDLDGTVIDSKDGIFGGIRYTMERLKMGEMPESIMRQFIGPSIGASFRRHYQFTLEQAEQAVSIYREYYGVQGLLECRLYDGIRELALRLKAQGKKVALATKKPEMYAKKIMDNLHMTEIFDGIHGSDPDDHIEDKGYVLLRAIEKQGITDKSQVLMVGDTKYDCIGAEIAGVDCLGVLYGYGNEADLLEHGAAGIAHTMAELTELLCGKEPVCP